MNSQGWTFVDIDFNDPRVAPVWMDIDEGSRILWMLELDATIYDFYLNSTSLNAKLAQQIHDHFLQDVLFDYLEGKSVVSIMGGHQLKRADPAYRDVALMAHRLAKRGFLVASGGGPVLWKRAIWEPTCLERQKVARAISLMAENQSQRVEFEYQDREGPQAVIENYGKPAFQPSLAIPTHKYAHEPTNMFGTWVASSFQMEKMVCWIFRMLVSGSAGTRQ